MWAIRKQPTAPTMAAIAAALVTAAVTVLYAYVIAGQEEDGGHPWLAGSSLLLAAFVLLTSTLVGSVQAKLLLLSLGAFTLLIWMVAGAFSIGVLLLPAVLLALVAAGRTASLLPIVEAWTIVIVGAAVSLLAVILVLESS
jgi:hypothetical protein